MRLPGFGRARPDIGGWREQNTEMKMRPAPTDESIASVTKGQFIGGVALAMAIIAIPVLWQVGLGNEHKSQEECLSASTHPRLLGSLSLSPEKANVLKGDGVLYGPLKGISRESHKAHKFVSTLLKSGSKEIVVTAILPAAELGDSSPMEVSGRAKAVDAGVAKDNATTIGQALAQQGRDITAVGSNVAFDANGSPNKPVLYHVALSSYPTSC